MVNTKFYVRFRLEDNHLVMEYDSGKNVVKVTIDGLKRIGGNGAVIFMGDTPNSAAGSLLSAGANLGAMFDSQNGFAYFEAGAVNIDIAAVESYINIIGAGTTGNFLYVVAQNVTKEVIPYENH